MFREMRRKKQLLSDDETIKILEQGTSGTLALLGDGDYPYAVPVSYVYFEGKLLFHSAKTGHKIDAVEKNSKASFCVIAQDQVLPEKYTTCFRSAIVFGRIRILKDDQLKRAAIERLAEKYVSDDKEGIRREIDLEYNAFCMLELEIEHMTGKRGGCI